MKNYAVISSDVNLDYNFFAPLTSLLWKKRGYVPILFLVGTVTKWLSDARLKLALEYSREVGAEIYFVPEVEGVRTSTVAQVVRFFASALPHVKDDDRLTTSDMDMFPLGPWVGGGIDESKAFTLFFSNAYKGEKEGWFYGRPQWPVCYLSSKAKVWREIVECEQGRFQEGLETVVRGAPQDAEGAWSWDEQWFAGRLTTWQGYPERVQEIPRTFAKGEWRIDRSAWDQSMKELAGSLEGVADAHLLRPGFGENWKRIRPILEVVLTQRQLLWADEYHREWINAVT